MPLNFDDLIPATPKLVGKRAGKAAPNPFDQFDPPQQAQPNPFDQFDDWQPVANGPAPQKRTNIFDPPPQSGGLNFDDLIPQKGNYFDQFDDWQPVGQQATFAQRFNAVSPPNTLADVAKQGAAGLAEGVAAIPSFVPHLVGLAGQGVSALANRFAPGLIDQEKERQQEALRQQLASSTPEAQMAAALPRPQTGAGEAARLVGNFVPAAVGMRGSIVGNLGAAGGAGLGAYGAGQLSPDDQTKPFLEAGGAILGGALGGAGAAKLGSVVTKLGRPAIPTEQELETAAKGAGQGYNHPVVAALEFKPQAGADLADSIKKNLLAAKVDQHNAPGLISTVDLLKTPRFGPNLTIDDLEAVRQDSVANPITAGSAERRGSEIVRKALDNYLGNVPQSDLLAGNADEANRILTAARGDFAAMKRSQDITNAMGRAENQAGATYSGGNLENATRQQLKPILNQKTGVAKSKGFQDYTDQEIGALRAAVNGSPAGNLVRTLGGLAGKGHGLGALGGAVTAGISAHEMGADPTQAIAAGVLTGLGGRALGALGNRLEVNRANAVGQMLRSRSPLAQSRGIPVGGYLNPQLSPWLLANPTLGALLQQGAAPQQ